MSGGVLVYQRHDACKGRSGCRGSADGMEGVKRSAQIAGRSEVQISLAKKVETSGETGARKQGNIRLVTVIVVRNAVHPHLPFGLGIDFAGAAAAGDDVEPPLRRGIASRETKLRAVVAPGNFRNVTFRGRTGDAVIARIPIRGPDIHLVEVGAAD